MSYVACSTRLNRLKRYYYYMKEKPRNKGKYVKEYTDEDFINAANKCLEEATCAAAEIAEKLGCNSRYAKIRLLQLSEHGKMKKKLKGTAWGFRP